MAKPYSLFVKTLAPRFSAVVSLFDLTDIISIPFQLQNGRLPSFVQQELIKHNYVALILSTDSIDSQSNSQF